MLKARLGKAIDVSGGSERELAADILGCRRAVRAAGKAGLGAGAEGLVNDRLDGARASATFNAAPEAVIDLLGATRQVFRRADCAADIMVAKDVAGTNNHECFGPVRWSSAIDRQDVGGMQKEKPTFQAIPN